MFRLPTGDNLPTLPASGVTGVGWGGGAAPFFLLTKTKFESMVNRRS
jgi:hypothetical protein